MIYFDLIDKTLDYNYFKIREKMLNILVQVYRKQGEELQYLHGSKGWFLDQSRQLLNS